MRERTILGLRGILKKKPRIKIKSSNTGFELEVIENHCNWCNKLIQFKSKYCSPDCYMEDISDKWDALV
jgi:hypothetical protein